MAQKKKNGTNTKKKTSEKKTSKSSTSKKAAAPAKEKKRNTRIIYTLVFFVLGVLTLLGYFNEGVVIRFLRDGMSGILGGGFYVLPPALLFTAGLFAVSREKPKFLRVFSVLMVPVMVGLFCQLVAGKNYPIEFSIFASLWNDGVALVGGGVVAGFIGSLFIVLFSMIGSWVIAIVLSLLIIWGVSGISIGHVIEVFKERREIRAQWREENAAEEARLLEEREKAEAKNKEKREAAYREKLDQRAERARKKAIIDIPIDERDSRTDDPENLEESLLKKKERPSLYNRKPNAKAPHELFEEQEAAAAPQKTAAAPSPETPEQVKAEPEKPAADKPAGEKRPRKAAEPAQDKKKDPPPEKSFEEMIGESAKRDLSEALQVYKYPPIDLLEAPRLGAGREGGSEVAAVKERLELILQSFGINAAISNVVRGPSVTRYEMELEIGVKLNKLTSLADDIALALGVSGVRIAAIPNKISTVGIEVPNKTTSTVYLREVISSPEFEKAKSKLTFALGKNIGGEVVIGNINKLPHLLIAGTTGSGKSVCLNSLILSLMYKATPDEVRFIMIDPKMVEFKIYNGIPHLLVPVVTEAKKAAGALQWAVTEMLKRYRLFSESGARDIAGYNEGQKQRGEQPLPFVVVIIDELADLMLVAAKEVEESICRVAQMGRAAGVHLVIATQSPRADVITGLMKANIPSRISFKVASALESRIILDAGGAADKLMGNGDMLFAPIGSSKPVRIQGTWVSDEEREKIVDFVKSSCEAVYSEDVIHEIEKAAEEKSGSKQAAEAEEKGKDYDELIPQAVDVILETQQASVSMLQRRLKLGYARAARLVDQMEEMGIVGPFEGSKPRQILITRQQWQEMQFINGTAPVEQPPEESYADTFADELFEDVPPEDYEE